MSLRLTAVGGNEASSMPAATDLDSRTWVDRDTSKPTAGDSVERRAATTKTPGVAARSQTIAAAVRPAIGTNCSDASGACGSETIAVSTSPRRRPNASTSTLTVCRPASGTTQRRRASAASSRAVTAAPSMRSVPGRNRAPLPD
jgi:hypothetical protein